MGNSAVGKSSILVQLTDKRFLGAGSEPTVRCLLLLFLDPQLTGSYHTDRRRIRQPADQPGERP